MKKEITFSCFSFIAVLGCICFTFCFCTPSSYGQNAVNPEPFDTSIPPGTTISLDSLKLLYEQHAVYFQGSFYVKNNMITRNGFFGRRLKSELRRSQAAATEIKTGNRKLAVGTALYAGGLVGAIIITSATASPISLLLLIPAIWGSVQMAEANDHYRKAVWNYNRDALIHNAKKKTN